MAKAATTSHDKAIATSVDELKQIVRRLRKVSDAQDMGEPVGIGADQLDAATSKVRSAVTDLLGPTPPGGD